jgi:iron-sulfur cluster repair protein YtfE (RIC family)
MQPRSTHERPSRGYTTITAYLSADHDRLDALFAESIKLLAADAIEAARVAFGRFHDGLKRHIALEENIVFPLFDQRTRIVGPLTVMRHEHQILTELLGRGRLALDRGDRAAFDAVVTPLQELIQAHNLKEERILYPRTDAALDEEERREVAGRLERT